MLQKGRQQALTDIQTTGKKVHKLDFFQVKQLVGSDYFSREAFPNDTDFHPPLKNPEGIMATLSSYFGATESKVPSKPLPKVTAMYAENTTLALGYSNGALVTYNIEKGEITSVNNVSLVKSYVLIGHEKIRAAHRGTQVSPPQSQRRRQKLATRASAALRWPALELHLAEPDKHRTPRPAPQRQRYRRLQPLLRPLSQKTKWSVYRNTA